MSNNSWRDTRSIKRKKVWRVRFALTNDKMAYYQIIFIDIWIYFWIPFISEENYPLRSAASSKLRPFSSRTKSFKNTFFPYCINKWSSLKAEIRNVKSLNIFKKLIIGEKKVFSWWSTRSKTSYTYQTCI